MPRKISASRPPPNAAMTMTMRTAANPTSVKPDPPSTMSSPPLADRSAGPGQHHDPDLRHVLDGPAGALTPQPGVLDAAVRHVVDPVRRDVIDDHAADLEPVERSPGMVQIVREDPRLEAEHRVVHAADGVLDVAEL